MRLHDYSSRNSRQHWINASNGKIKKEEMELTLRGKQAPTTPQAEPVGLFAQHQEELF